MLLYLCLLLAGSYTHAKATKGVFKNGLAYELVPHKWEDESLYLYLALKVGAVDESTEQEGMAHLLEHLVLGDSRALYESKSLMAFLASIGVEFGSQVNGLTHYDRTVYRIQLPKKHQDKLPVILKWIQHIWSLEPTQDDLEVQKNIVVNEYNTRAVNPQDTNLLARCWNSSYRHRANIIGTMPQLLEYTQAQVLAFHRAHYKAENAKLWILNYDGELTDNTQASATPPSPARGKVTPSFKLWKLQELEEEPNLEFLHTVQENQQQARLFVRIAKHRIKQQAVKGMHVRLWQFANHVHHLSIRYEKDFFNTLKASSGWLFQPVSEQEFACHLKQLTPLRYYTREEWMQAEVDNFVAPDAKQLPNLKSLNAWVSSLRNSELWTGLWQAADFDDTDWEIHWKQLLENQHAEDYVFEPPVEQLVAKLDSMELPLRRLPFHQAVEHASWHSDSLYYQLKLHNGLQVYFKPTTKGNTKMLKIDLWASGGSAELNDSLFMGLESIANFMALCGVENLTAEQWSALRNSKSVYLLPYLSEHRRGYLGRFSSDQGPFLSQVLQAYFGPFKLCETEFKEELKQLVEQAPEQVAPLHLPPGFQYGFDKERVLVNFSDRPYTETKSQYKRLNFKNLDEYHQNYWQTPADYSLLIQGGFSVDSLAHQLVPYLGGLKKRKQRNYHKRSDHPFALCTQDTVVEKKYKSTNQVLAEHFIQSYFPYELSNLVALEVLSKVLETKVRKLLRNQQQWVYSPAVVLEVKPSPSPYYRLSISYSIDQVHFSQSRALLKELVQHLDFQDEELHVAKQQLSAMYAGDKDQTETYLKAGLIPYANTAKEAALDRLTKKKLRAVWIRLLKDKNWVSFKAHL